MSLIKHGDPITKPLHAYTQSRPLLVPSTHSYAEGGKYGGPEGRVTFQFFSRHFPRRSRHVPVFLVSLSSSQKVASRSSFSRITFSHYIPASVT